MLLGIGGECKKYEFCLPADICVIDQTFTLKYGQFFTANK